MQLSDNINIGKKFAGAMTITKVREYYNTSQIYFYHSAKSPFSEGLANSLNTVRFK